MVTIIGALCMFLCLGSGVGLAAPTPRVDLFEHPAFPPGVDSGALLDALERRSGGLRTCYQMGLETNPGLRGDLGVSLSRKDDGETAATLVTSDLKSPDIERCMLDVLSAVRFAAPPPGSTFQPLEFTFRFSVVSDVDPPDLRLHVQSCYGVERRKDPRMEGRIQVHLALAADGTVAEVAVQPTVPAVAGMATCVQERLVTATFAPDPSGQPSVWNLAFDVAPMQ